MSLETTQFPDDPLALLFQDNQKHESSPRRRWYDQNPDLLIATETLRMLPLEYQKLVTESLLEQADLKNMAYPQSVRLKNLGTDRILGLMSSQFRRRWYDKDVSLHKAFCALLLMPDAFRTIVGRKIGHSAQSIVAYTQWCERSQLEIDHKLMKSRVSQVFLQDKLPSLMQPEFLKFFDEQSADHELAARREEEALHETDYSAADDRFESQDDAERLLDQMWNDLDDNDDDLLEDSEAAPEQVVTGEVIGVEEEDADASLAETGEDAGETQSTIASSEKGMQVKNQQVKPAPHKGTGKNRNSTPPKK